VPGVAERERGPGEHRSEILTRVTLFPSHRV
jgi:hypothetical protein